MKRYFILIFVLLVLASGLVVGCGEETTTYYNHKFGYSVEMPKDWEVVEKQLDENTVVFRSKIFNPKRDLFHERDQVSVRVVKNKSARSAIGEQSINTERRLWEHGRLDTGFIVEERRLTENSWSISFLIEHNKHLYCIYFSDRSAKDKARVSIDGYGKVN